MIGMVDAGQASRYQYSPTDKARGWDDDRFRKKNEARGLSVSGDPKLPDELGLMKTKSFDKKVS